MKQRTFPQTKDISGHRFGKLVALYPISFKATGNNTCWVCQCDCGNKTISNGANLRRGHKKSCGCIKHRVTPTFLTWNGEKKSVCEWAIITGISPDLIRKRWKAGWPVDAIFTEVEKPQLCWGCAKACGGCSWSKRFEPVPGWTAVPTLLCERIPSYRITECPEFVSDGTEYDADE